MRSIAFYTICMQGRLKKTKIEVSYIFKYDLKKLNIT